MDKVEESSLSFCPVARGLEKVGDAWSMLILRDLSLGHSRFEALRVSLGIAPNILTARLRALVDAGLVVKRRYSERPPRDEYVLSDAGRDFLPVLHVIGEWGRRHNGAGGTSRLVDMDTETLVEPVVVDRHTGKPLAGAKLRLAPVDDPLVSGAAPKRGWLLD
jgi:DNA-binding HxlR family transcriptional regulator